jgi:hypothetical protein
MEIFCKNCEYFARRSVMPSEHVWGHCTKPGRYSIDATGRRRLGVFKWEDDTCDDFKPRKVPEEGEAPDSG